MLESRLANQNVPKRRVASSAIDSRNVWKGDAREGCSPPFARLSSYSVGEDTDSQP